MIQALTWVAQACPWWLGWLFALVYLLAHPEVAGVTRSAQSWPTGPRMDDL